ncbi:OmpA family protein [Ancylothrix sp. C2]|uniref:OmpA family protein n=1 Tax=Ancylothrix sp. D3o TaxID=2953691 RepID=UPI0021BBA2C6|nr:OmpA family protein [Ancylothrix sp. D3o]MCT7948516.1 OmpA family protein [Ancylothrix sp. D3o]
MALSEENRILAKEDSEKLVSTPAASPDSHTVDLETLLNLLLGVESPVPVQESSDTGTDFTSDSYDDTSNGKAYNEEPSEKRLATPEPLNSLEESGKIDKVKEPEIGSVSGEIEESEDTSKPAKQENLKISAQVSEKTLKSDDDAPIDYQPDLSALDEILERWQNRLIRLKTEGEKAQEISQGNRPEQVKERPVLSSEMTREVLSSLLLGGIAESETTANRERETLEPVELEVCETLTNSNQEKIVAPELTPETEIINFFADSEEQNQNIDSANMVQANSPENPLEQLQNLLLGSQISQLDELKKLVAETGLPGMREMIEILETKLGQLEHKLTDSKELISLLVPWIAEILSLKVAASKEEVIKALVPIIDDVIRERTQQDKQAMSAAIGELLPAAISQEITNSPKEIAKAIGPEIGEAIREQIRIDRDEIISTLAPEMGRAIKGQIELERDAMVDALYPVIGSTIAKYLSEAIRTINKKVENAFSMEGMRRKLKAKMQGVSEAELILHESIPFTVQAVFLIQKTSGLVISEAQRCDSEKLESEMVAGMLTAIRSFVNDCIVKKGEISELNQIDYGDSRIILEVAGYCYLAVIEKGEAPKEFIEKLRDTLGKIILYYGQPIEEFDGDTSTIPDALQARLALLMGIESDKKKKPKSPLALIVIGLAVLTAILVPWGISEHRRSIEQRIQAKTATALASTPELAVYRLNVNTEGGVIKLSGQLPNEAMRAKAEQIARLNAGELKLENEILAVEVPPDPLLMAAEVKRLTSVFNQMNGVAISAKVEDQKVSVWGTVMQMADAEKITGGFASIPGVKAVVSTMKLNPLNIASRIYFESGSAKVNPGYEKNLREINEFLNQYPQKYLKIIGHSDSTGNKAANQRIAVLRATAVRDALVKQGADPKRLQIAGNGNPPADVGSNQPLLLSRCVVFEPVSKEVQK